MDNDGWFVVEPPDFPNQGTTFVNHARPAVAAILAMPWSNTDPAKPMGDEPGRIWDAIVHNGTIFVLELHIDSKVHWYGHLPEHHYSLYVSTDNGRTFRRRSILPFEIDGRGYGTMAVLTDGSLIAYIYNNADEKHLDYLISRDGGDTWSDLQTAYFAKQIGNPQMAAFKDGYVLHGRSGSKGEDSVKGHFVLYASRDGMHWDDGRYLQMRTAGAGAYSNDLLVGDTHTGVPNRLLIQASHAYAADKDQCDALVVEIAPIADLLRPPLRPSQRNVPLTSQEHLSEVRNYEGDHR